MTPRQREKIEAVGKHGSRRKAAKALNVNHSAIDKAIAVGRKSDPAWVEAALKHGFNASHAGWWKTAPADGEPGVSVYIGRAQADATAGIRAALEAYEGRIDPKPAPRYADADLLNLVTVPDWHAGMHAWRRETGEDYDLATARDCLADCLSRTIPRLPPASRGVILAPGDTVHTNDARNMTPKSGHLLDADGRYLKIMETAAASMISGVDLMLLHHLTVDVVILPGNHDPETALMLALALRMFYSREPRVTVHDGAGFWWAVQHGAVMLCATHGHQIKQSEMGPYIAAEFAPMWGATRYRFAFSGHIHHERTREFPGLLCEALRPVTARDAHAAGSYHSQREISAMTFHKTRGRVSRVYEAIA